MMSIKRVVATDFQQDVQTLDDIMQKLLDSNGENIVVSEHQWYEILLKSCHKSDVEKSKKIFERYIAYHKDDPDFDCAQIIQRLIIVPNSSLDHRRIELSHIENMDYYFFKKTMAEARVADSDYFLSELEQAVTLFYQKTQVAHTPVLFECLLLKKLFLRKADASQFINMLQKYLQDHFQDTSPLKKELQLKLNLCRVSFFKFYGIDETIQSLGNDFTKTPLLYPYFLKLQAASKAYCKSRIGENTFVDMFKFFLDPDSLLQKIFPGEYSTNLFFDLDRLNGLHSHPAMIKRIKCARLLHSIFIELCFIHLDIFPPFVINNKRHVVQFFKEVIELEANLTHVQPMLKPFFVELIRRISLGEMRVRSYLWNNLKEGYLNAEQQFRLDSNEKIPSDLAIILMQSDEYLQSTQALVTLIASTRHENSLGKYTKPQAETHDQHIEKASSSSSTASILSGLANPVARAVYVDEIASQTDSHESSASSATTSYLPELDRATAPVVTEPAPFILSSNYPELDETRIALIENAPQPRNDANDLELENTPAVAKDHPESQENVVSLLL